MSESPKPKCKHGFLSVRDLILRPIVITVFFAIAHFCGLREYTSFISGTAPTTSFSPTVAGFFGLSYLVLYFAFMLLVPILLIAAGLVTLWNRSDKN